MGQHRLNARRIVILAIGVVCLPWTLEGAGATENGYYERKEEGWFWKERMLDPIGEPEPPMPSDLQMPNTQSEPIPQPSEPAPLSPAWMRESLPKYLDRALSDPTPENVRAYFLLQRYAMDRAEEFALVAQKVVMSDPTLDENTRRPISSYGASIFDQEAQRASIELATKIARMAGVWYFYRSDCPFCEAQNPVLMRLVNRIGLTVLPIALDGAPMPDGVFPRFVPNRGHAEQMGVQQTPTLVLVRSGQFVLLSEGLVTEENLIHRLIAAGHEAGWITDAEFNQTRAVRPSTLTVDDNSTLDELELDPTRLAEILRLAPP